MKCARCQTDSQRVDYVQVYYQEWICAVCLLAKAMEFMGHETQRQNRRPETEDV